jgi:hypothetical protein
MASSRIPINLPVAKQITLQPATSYDEVLAIIPRRLYGTAAIGVMPEFFLEVIEAYTPTLLSDIREYCTGDDNHDALLWGEAAVLRLARRIATLRTLPSEAYELVDPAYELVIEAFAAAHSEEFHPEGGDGGFADDFRNWRRGA